MKNIILCFDGTNNEPADALPKKKWFGLGKFKDSSISNVLKLHLLLGGTLKNTHHFNNQLCFYYSGVGTYGSRFQKLRNSFRAPPQEDVGDIIKAGIRDLYNHYQAGDRVCIFGFSRGAAIARRFATVLDEATPALGWDKKPEIHFMGVFDTVAALKKPNLFDEKIKPASDVVFENGSVSSLVQKALHLLSIDERRIAFLPTLMNQDTRVTEVWFSGVHSDIGGGYKHDGLSDVSLQFMLDFIEQQLEFDLQVLQADEVDYENLDKNKKIVIDLDDVLINGNIFAKIHHQTFEFIKRHFLTYRSPRININDKHSIYSPLIHHSVFERRVKQNNYKPAALFGDYFGNPYTGKKPGIKIINNDFSIKQYPDIDSAIKDYL